MLTVALCDLYNVRACKGTPGSGIYKTLYGNPLDFSKIYDIFMNDDIKLTYLLLSVYLFVMCTLGPFGAILNDLSLAR